MPRFNRRSNTGVYLVLALANPAAPTVAEINGGVAIHPVLAATSGWSSDQADLPVPDLADTWDDQIPGGETPASSSLTIWSGDADADQEETVRAALVEGTNAFVVWTKRAKTAVSGAPADVFPVRIKATNEQYAVENAGAQYMTGFSLTDRPSRHVAIAA